MDATDCAIDGTVICESRDGRPALAGVGVGNATTGLGVETTATGLDFTTGSTGAAWAAAGVALDADEAAFLGD